MRAALISGLLVSLTLAFVTAAEGAENRGETLKLFVSGAASGDQVPWKAIGKDGPTDASELCEIRDGLLVIKAGTLGYLRTEGDFASFVLDVEWRRPPEKKPGRGGVLIRMTGPDKIWPKSLEAQLNAQAAGDFWGLDGYQLSGPSDRLKTVKNEQLGTLTNLKKTQDAERPTGQWNRYEIRAVGAAVTLTINGRVVNEATGCDVVAGKICLTAEGDEIQFRNVRLTPMPDGKTRD